MSDLADGPVFGHEHIPWCGRGDQDGGHGEQSGECEESDVDGGSDGDRADEQQATSVAELTADFGGTHGLAEPLRRSMGARLRSWS